MKKVMPVTYTCIKEGTIRVNGDVVTLEGWHFGVIETGLELVPYIFIGGDCSKAVISIHKRG